MEAVRIVLILLMAVVVGHIMTLFITRFLKIAIPTPLIQIAVGAALAAFGGLGVALRPELFMLLFLPPLLFSDGWSIPKEGLIRDRWTILEMALFLVVFTVIFGGYFMHWLIPAMPLAVAFALAAIMSPTDPVAVSAITAKVSVPKRLLHILEGESLLNDASGLVSMRFAVAAAMTGSFSLFAAFGTFLWTALAGLIIGAATTFVIARTANWLFARFQLEAGSQIIISLLIPFIAYLLAEHIEASGILAAVAAGIMMSFIEDYAPNAATTRMRRLAVWNTLQFVANGIIFVLLGEQLPEIISGAANVVRDTGHQNPLWLLVYVALIYAALIVLRFIWVWVSLRFTLFNATRRGIQAFNPGWKLVAATSFAGVRGTVTLAGVLTLPLFLADGRPFPVRDLAIFLAAGVIVLSLIAASIALPFLLCGLKLPQEASSRKDEETAQAAAYEAAIQAVETETHNLCQGQSDADIYTNAGAHIMQIYRDRLTSLSADNDSEEKALRHEQDNKVEKLLRLRALEAERHVYYDYKRRRLLPEESANKFLHAVDLVEAQLSAS